ncbi:hybrid sensor histidine kinase/response regulator [Geothrix sp. 21YS21S-4]|uniref:hybrid sensor histidine kinase/response regulator n=1 Tax=Geothrix sp. 21YS21S-4 TaxID=3068889 RepID=UPI0027BAB321|nr:hybrid sensor histidine kinase/response regulator [Geothrix sp. 21YS21S-4]
MMPVSVGAPARLLVVDDAESNLEVMTRILEREGHQVVTASGGAEGLAKLRDGDYDMVLLDVMMPGVDGIQVMQAIRDDERLKRIPVVMLSALHEQDTIVKCIQLGAQDYLPKPINQQLLKARIKACLERKRLQDLEDASTLRLEAVGAQLRAANEQLRRANQLKSRFLATAAHDLKNPLGGILLLADRIRMEAERGAPPERIAAQAGRVHEVVQKMVHIINSLLDTTVQEMGEVIPAFEMADLGSVIRAVVRENEPYAASKGIRLHCDAPDGLCRGVVDRARLAQAVDNLVNNAIKYSPGGSEIQVGLEHHGETPGGVARIGVIDQGPGFTPEDLDRAFAPFQRLSARPTGGEHSTGLGLSIVKQMVELNGGRVWIEGDRAWGGAFHVEIPLRELEPTSVPLA